jgi:hypothetical protein
MIGLWTRRVTPRTRVARTHLAAAIGALAGTAPPAAAAIPPVAIGALAGTAPPAAAATPPAPTPASARLEGQFLLSGRITVATNVRGEHAGQSVTRTWTFTPGCPAGVCTTIGLSRRRSGGTDNLALRLRSPGYYVGNGRFFAPLRCGGRTIRQGASVPFSITVRVTAATLAGSDVVATRINATYTNRSRSNLTDCVAFLGHDAATYQGQVVPQGSPTGGVGPGA